jgi:hypothetical protein
VIFHERERPDGCLTDLTFDAWFACELTASAIAAAEAHLATCERCRRRRAALDAERKAFLAQRPALEIKPAQRGRGRRQGLLAFGAFAAAAGLVLLVGLLQERPEPIVRVKGGPGIGFFVERRGSSKRGTEGEVVYPGDRVHFVYTSDKPIYLAIYSLDSRGTASIFFPGSERALGLPAASEAALSSAVELDDAPGPETVFAVFCDTGFLVERFRKSLAERRSLEAPAGCRLDVLTWTKGRAN